MTKSAKIKRILIVLLVTVLAVALPASFAKYIDSKTYTLHLTKTEVFKFFYNTSNSKMAEKVELPKAGRYAIIVKGGDGADNYVWNSTTKVNNSYIYGGKGGTVVGVYTTTEDHQYVYVSAGGVGNKPEQPNGVGAGGEPGKNSLSMLNGGKGGIMEATGGFYDAIIKFAAVAFSQSPSGAGGGAASIVYACDSSGHYDKDSDLLLLAGGGGGASSWNSAYASGNIKVPVINKNSVPSGAGGNGSGNFLGDSVAKSDSSDMLQNYSDWKISTDNNFTRKYMGFIIAGLSGEGNATQGTYGKGGSTKPGAGGTVNNVGILSGSPADAGTAYASGGTGGEGSYYGGGGGGGYCGGGGGAGSSIDVAAGGGGAGSSAISSWISQDISDKICSDMITDAKSTKTCWKNGVIPDNSTGKSNGYIIIRYLGPVEQSTPVPSGIEIETKSLFDVMESIVSISKDNKPKSGSTEITNSSSNAFYKAVMDDPCIKLLLDKRAWTISVNSSGNVSIEFTDNRNTTIEKNTKFWKYENGQMYSGIAKETSKWSFAGTYYSYSYPETWTADSSFVLTSN